MHIREKMEMVDRFIISQGEVHYIDKKKGLLSLCISSMVVVGYGEKFYS